MEGTGKCAVGNIGTAARKGIGGGIGIGGFGNAFRCTGLIGQLIVEIQLRYKTNRNIASGFLQDKRHDTIHSGTVACRIGQIEV